MQLELKSLQRLVQLTGLALATLVVMLFLAVVTSRLTSADGLKATIEQVASDNSGFAITVGHVRGAWWSGLTLEDVVVHQGPDPKSGVLARVPVAQAEYSLLSFFGAHAHPIRLDLYHPRVDVVLGRDHLMNIQPRLRGPQDEPPFVAGPPVDLVFHGASVSYTDRTGKPFTAALENVTGQGTIRGPQLALNLQALRDADILHADVGYDLQAQHGHVHAWGHDLGMPYWLDRFAASPDWRLLAGRADLDATVDWQDPMILDELKLKGTLRFHDGTLGLRTASVPIRDLHGSAVFDEQTAHLSGIAGTLEGMPLSLEGLAHRLVQPVPALGVPDPGLALTIEAPAIDLGRLAVPFPDLAVYHLQGRGRAIAQVSGTTLDPRVAVTAFVPAGRFNKERVADGVITGIYRPGSFDVQHFRFALGGGVASGQVHYDFPAAPHQPIPYLVTGRFAGLDATGLVQRYMAQPPAYPISGRVAGAFRLAGAGAHTESRIDLDIRQGRIAGIPLAPLATRYESTECGWALPALHLNWGHSVLDGALSGDAAGHFALRFRLPHGELAELVKLAARPPTTPMHGLVSAEGQLGGDFDRETTWRGQANVGVRDGALDGQPVASLTAHLQAIDNRLLIQGLKAHAMGSAIRGEGVMAPFMGPRDAVTTTQLALMADRVDLARVEGLPAALKGLGGTLGARLDVTLAGDDYRVAGRTTIEALALPGTGRLDHAAAQFVWDPTAVRFSSLTLQNGAAQVGAVGRIGLGAKPDLDLTVKTRHTAIADLLAAVDWDAVEKRLLPHSAAAHPVGPADRTLALPGAVTTRPDGSLDLGAALSRWDAYQKAPINVAGGRSALLPFWQGTQGTLTATLHLTGPRGRPVVRLDGEVAPLTIFNRTLDDATVSLAWDGRRLRLPSLRIREGGRTVVTAGGAFGERPRDVLVFKTHGLDLGWSDHLLAARKLKLEGHANLTLIAHGPWQSPRFIAAGELSQGRLVLPDAAPLPYDVVRAELAYEGGFLDVPQASLRRGAQEASMTGRIPISDDLQGAHRPFDLSCRLDNENLGIVNLFSRGRFQWQGGQGRATLHLGGTALHPTLDGSIRLHDGTLSVPDLGAPLTNLTADVRLTDQMIAINTMTARYGGGEARLNGVIDWDQFTPRHLDLAIETSPFKVLAPNRYYQGLAQASLKLDGEVAQPALSGLVTLSDGFIMLKEHGAAGTSAAAPSRLWPLQLNALQVALAPRLHVKNALLDVDVTTPHQQPLRVDGTLDDPQPRGVVTIESGTIRPLNNTFNVTDGKVEFIGAHLGAQGALSGILNDSADADALNGRIDVSASTLAYDYDTSETLNISTRVTGPLDHMTMAFTSDPIRSQQQILDILSKKQVLEGTVNGKLDRSQVIVQEVGSLVTGNIEDFVSPYTLFLRNALNLRTFRFELVNDYQNTSLSNLAGYKPALLIETRPLWDRLSFDSQLVVGDIYTTAAIGRGANTYVGMNLLLNRNLAMEYRLDPYIDPENQQAVSQTLGVKAQWNF